MTKKKDKWEFLMPRTVKKNLGHDSEEFETDSHACEGLKNVEGGTWCEAKSFCLQGVQDFMVVLL